MTTTTSHPLSMDTSLPPHLHLHHQSHHPPQQYEPLVMASFAPLPACDLFASYTFGDVVGEGQSGRVWRCHDRQTGEPFACKQIRKRNLSDVQLSDLRREVEAMLRLRGHRNVLSLLGLYEDDKAVYLVTELCEAGDLFSLIADRHGLDERAAARVFAQVASAVKWCHVNRVVHRDIKPENILLSRQPSTPPAATDASSRLSPPSSRKPGGDGDNIHVRLADFGLAFPLKPGAAVIGAAGSVPYEAPEVLALAPYNYCADVWSLGVLLYAMLSANWPAFPGNARKLLPTDFRPQPWPSISFEAKDLIRRMLTVDPMERLDICSVLDHPWLRTHLAPAARPAQAQAQAPTAQASARVRHRLSVPGAPPASAGSVRPCASGAEDATEVSPRAPAPSMPARRTSDAPSNGVRVPTVRSASNARPVSGPMSLVPACASDAAPSSHRAVSRLKPQQPVDEVAVPPSPSKPPAQRRPLRQASAVNVLRKSACSESFNVEDAPPPALETCTTGNSDDSNYLSSPVTPGTPDSPAEGAVFTREGGGVESSALGSKQRRRVPPKLDVGAGGFDSYGDGLVNSGRAGRNSKAERYGSNLAPLSPSPLGAEGSGMGWVGAGDEDKCDHSGKAYRMEEKVVDVSLRRRFLMKGMGKLWSSNNERQLARLEKEESMKKSPREMEKPLTPRDALRRRGLVCFGAGSFEQDEWIESPVSPDYK
eukprot:TRINITY_DN5617_c0_g1_i1.p1 TRINITY_DN5617_c0_g1~~TRINITY_DN5617_c0_g1_i1.p1  ORF type:complete len:708 (+),score=-52.92 TRINITY_DN5617_c0_g1_i1:121-2244(+)